MHPSASCFKLFVHCDAPRRLPRRLDRRQQQRHQNADDGDHDQQLHQRERTAAPTTLGRS